MKVACIINPVAGPRHQAAEIERSIGDLAAKHGWDLACATTSRRGEGTDLARRFAAEDAEVVVAAGGDGTIHEVARGLIGSTAALGIVPAGSGNGLARALRIPLDVARAIEVLADGEPRPFDVGFVNGTPFFSTAGFGLDAEVARRFDERTHRRGILSYVWHGAREWLAYAPDEVRMTIAGPTGERTIVETPLVVVLANTEQYGGGAIIAPGARPDDGYLRFCRLQPMTAAVALAEMPRLFRGTLASSPRYAAEDVVSVVIERPRAGWMQVDGEPVMAEATLRFAVDPGAIRVWMPRDV